MKSLGLTLFLIYVSISMLAAQPQNEDDRVSPELYNRYVKSVAYLNSFKIDKADIILDSILTEIKGTELEDSPFGLRVQVRKGEALERDQEGDLAIFVLHDVKVKSQKIKLWDTYALASINLALLYERIGKGFDCIKNLRDAQRILNKHPDLDFIYPFFCVRISSYHRIYESRDSALYYANEVIRTYEKFNDLAQGGDGYMLLTMLTENSQLDKRIEYARLAADIFKIQQNYNAYSSMIGGLAGFNYQKQNYEKAILYSDTAIMAAKQSIAGGYDQTRTLYSSYKFRGEIYTNMGLLDSANFYIKKGYDLQNEHIFNENQNKVKEVVAKYENDQKAQKIEEQSAQIKSEKTRQKLIMIIFGLGSCFTIGLAFYYNKMRKAKIKAEQLTEEIKKTNDELSISLKKQIILQGEVHHRVKNNLQVIISLLDLHKDELKDEAPKMQIDSMSKRIYSMSAIHNLLYQKDDMEYIKLHAYVEDLCYHFSNFSLKENKPIFSLDIEDVNLNLETSMPIGIIITELLNNSLKYARVKGQPLEIDIKIVRKNEGLEILFKDNGPGFKAKNNEPEKTGLGFYILESMTRQLQGNLIRKYENGACYIIYLKEKNKLV